MNSGKCKPNSSSDEVDLIGMDGTWYVSSGCIKEDDGRSSPMEIWSETLGVSSVQSGWVGINEKGSTDGMPSRCKAEEEEGVLCLLLEEAPLMSLSRSGRGLTILESKCDIVCL